MVHVRNVYKLCASQKRGHSVLSVVSPKSALPGMGKKRSVERAAQQKDLPTQVTAAPHPRCTFPVTTDAGRGGMCPDSQSDTEDAEMTDDAPDRYLRMGKMLAHTNKKACASDVSHRFSEAHEAHEAVCRFATVRLRSSRGGSQRSKR